MPTYGQRPQDIVVDSRGNALRGVTVKLYATEAAAFAGGAADGTSVTDNQGRWSYTSDGEVWARTPDGTVWQVAATPVAAAAPEQLTILADTAATTIAAGEAAGEMVGYWVTSGTATIDGVSYPAGVYTFAWDGAAWFLISSGSATAPDIPDTTPPSTPGGLAYTATSSTLTLTWNASTDDTGVESYDVSRDSGATVYNVIAGTGYAREYEFTGLDPETGYTLQVRARDLSGNLSDWATLAATTAAGPVNTAPTAPGSLTGTPADTSVALTWTAATDDAGVVAYRVSHKETSAGSWTVDTSTETTLGYTVTGLTEGTSYDFEVEAGDAEGLWGPAATTTVSTTAPATDDSVLAFALDEGTGTTTADRDGLVTLPAGSSRWIVGKHGNAQRANVVNASSTTPYLSLAGYTGLTIMANIRAHASEGPAANAKAGAVALYTGNTSSVEANLIAAVGIKGGATYGSVGAVLGRIGSTEVVHTFGTDVAAVGAPGRWDHVALVWDDATNVMTLYYNGVAQATTGSFTGPLTTSVGGINLNGWAASPTAICDLGKDNVRVFTRALSASEVATFAEQAVA